MENSKVEWTTHTFNPWRGCTKVSEGCRNCYAETLSGRNPGTLGVWGPNGTRVVASESMWREPVKWDKKAKAAGERHRVFCASLADVFEGPATMPAAAWDAVTQARKRLGQLILDTPNLDWLLLTKRPENVTAIAADMWVRFGGPTVPLPPNVWVGTSVENQQAADERIPHLLRVPAVVRFLSCEPLLGPVDIREHLSGDSTGRETGGPQGWQPGPAVDWVIVGGESGRDARPMHPKWARSLRDQCQAAGVAFHFKQWGEWAPLSEPFRYTPAFGSGNAEYVRELNRYAKSHGCSRVIDDRPEGWGPSMIRNGTCLLDGETGIGDVGKKAAGRVLDGHTWDELPTGSKTAG